MPDGAKMRVLYDGACPLCDSEIDFYRGLKGADAVDWIDVSRAGPGNVAPGLSREQALARFHVIRPDGTSVSGGPAFAALWRVLPAFRPLGWLFRPAPLAWLLDRSYDGFLRVRPRIQAFVPRRDRAVTGAMPGWLVRELRSDHAGETGAVATYQGILAVSGDETVRAFAASHLKTEQTHLELIGSALPPGARSRLLSLWRVSGWLTGAIPALCGRNAVYATIDAVETFVDQHYATQIRRLDAEAGDCDLRALLERCRLDEVAHRDEARDALTRPPSRLTRLWCAMVGSGSAAAVALARRV